MLKLVYKISNSKSQPAAQTRPLNVWLWLQRTAHKHLNDFKMNYQCSKTRVTLFHAKFLHCPVPKAERDHEKRRKNLWKKCTVLQVVVYSHNRHSCVHNIRWTGFWNAVASINLTAGGVCALTAGQWGKNVVQHCRQKELSLSLCKTFTLDLKHCIMFSC